MKWVAVAATLLLAGCAGSPEGGPEGSPSLTTPAPSPPSSGEGGPAPPAGGPAAAQPDWVLPDCRQASVTTYHDREAGSEGLPADHELQGEGVATLVLLAVDCPAAVVGNTTVIEPFRLAFVYHLLRPFDDRADAVDGFLREGFASDAATAGRMAAFGLPVSVAQITLSAPGEPLDLRVTAAGTSYHAVGGPAAQEPEPTSGSFLYRLRRATDDRWLWLQDEATLLASAGVATPVFLQAEGGYLSGALPGGSAAALRQDASSTSLLALVDLEF